MRIVEILGTIGVGKSYLMAQFPEKEWVHVHEPVDENPYLDAFYAELEYITKARNRFPVPSVTTPFLEIYMTTKRTMALWDAIEIAENKGKNVVTDFGRPEIFAYNLHKAGIISSLHYDTFLMVAKIARKSLLLDDGSFVFDRPGLRTVETVILTGYEKAFERMQKRARPCEKKVSIEYLKQLEETYLSFFKATNPEAIILESKENLTYQEVMEMLDSRSK